MQCSRPWLRALCVRVLLEITTKTILEKYNLPEFCAKSIHIRASLALAGTDLHNNYSCHDAKRKLCGQLYVT